MDIQLPGMDALSATRVIKEDSALKEMLVIAITGFAMPEDEKKAMEAGCIGCIAKPIDTRSFLKTVSGFIAHDDP